MIIKNLAQVLKHPCWCGRDAFCPRRSLCLGRLRIRRLKRLRNSKIGAAARVLAFVYFIIFSGISCSTKNINPNQALLSSLQSPTPQPPSMSPGPGDSKQQGFSALQRLTSQGSNSWPRFSEDGLKFLFISKNRANHERQQLYEFDFLAKQEKRLTYQDGDITSALYITKEIIAYSSSTDELKERPIRLKASLASSEPRSEQLSLDEIYLSDRYGDSITRITQHPGKDRLLSFKKTSPQKVFFSRDGNERTEFWESSLPQAKERLLYWQGRTELSNLTWIDASQKWVWLEQSSDTDRKVWVASKSFKDAQALKLPKGNYRNFVLSANQDKLIVAAELASTGKAKIYAYSFSQECFWLLTDSDANLDQPSLSPNGKLLLLVSNSTGDNQIYLANIDLVPKNCLPPSP